MYLTKEQEKVLDGEYGEGPRIAMELITRIGDIYGADRLVKISSSHVLGHFGSLHVAGVEMMEKFANGGARVKVPTTVDPLSIELDRWHELKIDPDYVEYQMRLKRALESMEVLSVYSCVPYQYGNVPRYGEILAWSESSAVAYANSIIGARTNRMTAGFDIACAITGLTPNFGLLLDENRYGQILVKVEKRDLSDLDYHTIGYIIGKSVGNLVPVIEGLPENASVDQLKGLSAAAASAGSVPIYHAVGISPDARTTEEAFGKNKPEDKIVIDEDLIRKTEDEITTSKEAPDFIAVGCPHFSISEMLTFYRKIENRGKVREGIEFWVYTSEYVWEVMKRMGIIDKMEKKGIKVLRTTCAVICPLKAWNFKVMMTNSAKYANVIPSEHGIDVYYTSLDNIIRYAFEGVLP